MEYEALKKSKVLEGNKLIAEFMGATLKLGSVGTYVFSESPSKEYSGSKFWHSSKLDYHESWDWLMPVVEKISDMCAYENGTGVTVLGISMLTPEKWRCHINYRIRFGGIKSEHKSFDITKESPVDAVWTAVTQFIKWYNSQPA